MKSKCRLAGNIWVVELPAHQAIVFKRLFAVVSKSQHGQLSFSNTPSNCLDLEWFFQRYPTEISEADHNALKATCAGERARIDKCKSFLESNDLPNIKLALPLRNYQSQAVRIGISNKSLLLGDVLGLGKTASAIGIIAHRQCRPAVVVVQTHLQAQWEREIKRFCPPLQIHVVKKSTPYKAKADVFIITYTKLHGWTETFTEMGVKTIVFDEIQELRRPDSGKYAAAKYISSHATYRIGLTATPIYNYGGEIYSVMNILFPGRLGSMNEFLREWCSDWSKGGIVTDPKALGEYLRSEMMFLRRDRKEVGRELPTENRIIVTVQHDEKVMQSMEKHNMHLAKLILEGTFTESGQAAREFDLKLRQATGVAKAPYVAEFVSELVLNGEKVLLAGWHREVYSIWEKTFKEKGIKYIQYTGSETPREKDEARERFMEWDTGVMAISLRSGAGLDGLQDSCSIVGFGELDWSDKVHEQVIGRILRDGQENHVTAFFFVADGGSDPTVANILGLKRAQSDGIVNLFSNQSIQTESVEGRIKQLANDFLKQHKNRH